MLKVMLLLWRTEGSALGSPLLGNVEDPSLHGGMGRLDRYRLAVDADLAGSCGPNAEDGLGELGAAGPHEPGEPKDLVPRGATRSTSANSPAR